MNGLHSVTEMQMKKWLQLQETKIKLDHLLVFINVGIDSIGNTSIRSPHNKGNHWVILDLDIVRKKYIYCDSLGWRIPSDLKVNISPIINILAAITECLLPLPCSRTPNIVKPAHVPGKLNEKGEHECTEQCLVLFPLQKCQKICGPVAVLTASICLLYPKLWCVLQQSHTSIQHHGLWFTRPSLYAEYIRKNSCRGVYEENIREWVFWGVSKCS